MQSTWGDRKRLDRKVYNYGGYSTNKRIARSKQKEYKRAGFLARVIAESSYGQKIYEIWTTAPVKRG